MGSTSSSENSSKESNSWMKSSNCPPMSAMSQSKKSELSTPEKSKANNHKKTNDPYYFLKI